MLDEIKNVNLTPFSLSDLVGLHFFISSTVEHFRKLGIDPPEWVVGKLRQCDREITLRHGAELDKKLLALKSQLNDLVSREEVEDEIRRLEGILGKKEPV